LQSLLGGVNPSAGLIHSGFRGTLLDLQGPNSILGDLQVLNRAPDQILGPRLGLGCPILCAPERVGRLIDQVDGLRILGSRQPRRSAPEIQGLFGRFDRRLAANVTSHMFSEPLHMVLRHRQQGFQIVNPRDTARQMVKGFLALKWPD
jgi:hypothetical protein